MSFKFGQKLQVQRGSVEQELHDFLNHKRFTFSCTTPQGLKNIESKFIKKILSLDGNAELLKQEIFASPLEERIKKNLLKNLQMLWFDEDEVRNRWIVVKVSDDEHLLASSTEYYSLSTATSVANALSENFQEEFIPVLVNNRFKGQL